MQEKWLIFTNVLKMEKTSNEMKKFKLFKITQTKTGPTKQRAAPAPWKKTIFGVEFSIDPTMPYFYTAGCIRMPLISSCLPLTVSLQEFQETTLKHLTQSPHKVYFQLYPLKAK